MVRSQEKSLNRAEGVKFFDLSSYLRRVVGDYVGHAGIEQRPDLIWVVDGPSMNGNVAQARSIDELSRGQTAFDHQKVHVQLG